MQSTWIITSSTEQHADTINARGPILAPRERDLETDFFVVKRMRTVSREFLRETRAGPVSGRASSPQSDGGLLLVKAIEPGFAVIFVRGPQRQALDHTHEPGGT